MQCEQSQVAGFVKQFGGPTVRLRGGLDIPQHGADVDRLAVVAAMISAELLHVENFMQTRKNAIKYYVTRGAWHVFLSPATRHRSVVCELSQAMIACLRTGPQ